LILQTDNVGLLFLVKIAQGIVLRQNLSIMSLMAFSGAVNAGFSGVGDLPDSGMAFSAAKFTMR
jgi:hypothetical protein